MVFDKYDKKGPYHWDFYYNQTQQYYVEIVNCVKSKVPRQSQVLDLGCGDGLIANVLAEELGCQVIGIDNNSTAIRLASEKNKNNNQFYCCNCESITYRNKFEVVLLVDIIEHVQNPQELIAVAAAALKDGGILVVSTPEYFPGKNIDPYHVREYSENELTTLFSPYAELIDISKIHYHDVNLVARWRKNSQ